MKACICKLSPAILALVFLLGCAGCASTPTSNQTGANPSRTQVPDWDIQGGFAQYANED